MAQLLPPIGIVAYVAFVIRDPIRVTASPRYSVEVSDERALSCDLARELFETAKN
jgi:hypothetical protein